MTFTSQVSGQPTLRTSLKPCFHHSLFIFYITYAFTLTIPPRNWNAPFNSVSMCQMPFLYQALFLDSSIFVQCIGQQLASISFSSCSWLLELFFSPGPQMNWTHFFFFLFEVSVSQRKANIKSQFVLQQFHLSEG